MVDESDAGGLALLEPPAWTILTQKLSPLSSTSLRAGKAKKKARAKKKQAGTKKAKSKTAKSKPAAKSAKRESRGKRDTVKKKARRH
jgi:hypothetical protein